MRTDNPCAFEVLHVSVLALTLWNVVGYEINKIKKNKGNTYHME